MTSDFVDVQLLHLLRERLQSSGIPAVAEVALEPGPLLTAYDRRLAITATVQDQTPGQFHAHVISWLPDSAAPDGKDKLDACVMGFGATVERALNQASDVWLRLVGAPVLSCLSARPLLDADHFEGHEEWGVPGGHGFVGPFVVRGGGDDIDLEALAKSPAFRLERYPRDGRPHLAKVTLVGRDGRWERHIEVDGHARQYTDEVWDGMPGPSSPVVCTRFAVFVME